MTGSLTPLLVERPVEKSCRWLIGPRRTYFWDGWTKNMFALESAPETGAALRSQPTISRMENTTDTRTLIPMGHEMVGGAIARHLVI